MVVADVKIWGKLAGAISWDEERQLGSFEYYPNFADNGWDLAPLNMPLNKDGIIFNFPELRQQKDTDYNTFKGLPGLIADALPDNYGNQLMDVWLAQQGRPHGSMNPIEQLCFIGVRSMGALEFEPARFQDVATVPDIELKSLVEITAKMLADREGFHANLSDDELASMQAILRLGTSAGGARPKALIAYNEKTKEVKSGQGAVEDGFEQWLIKLDGVSEAQFGESLGYGRVEMAYYLMAKAAGIDMMPCELLEENGRAHFLTKRFDRGEDNAKHHIQTWCAMAHADFNTLGVYSYEQLFQLMRQLLLPYPQAEELFRRMVFNVIARNCDDHTKNFAFRMKKGQKWELAPAYDICYAYSPTSYWVNQHNISINGKRKDISRNDLIKVANSMNIKKPNLIIDQINAVVSQWEEYASEVGVSKELRKRIGGNLFSL